MDTFEERLSAALVESQEMAGADPGGGRAVFQTYVRTREQRHRLTVMMRVAAVVLVAAIGTATAVMRLNYGPIGDTVPSITPPDRSGQHIEGKPVDDPGMWGVCVRRSFGGCQLTG